MTGYYYELRAECVVDGTLYGMRTAILEPEWSYVDYFQWLQDVISGWFSDRFDRPIDLHDVTWSCEPVPAGLA